jgi:hypothetical protein
VRRSYTLPVLIPYERCQIAPAIEAAPGQQVRESPENPSTTERTSTERVEALSWPQSAVGGSSGGKFRDLCEDALAPAAWQLIKPHLYAADPRPVDK